MTRPTLAPIIILASSIAAVAAPSAADPAAKQLQVYPKNLARQHLGANMFMFDSGSQSFKPTEVAAAWMDDDSTTGWAAMAGKQHYLLALPEPEVVSNFSVSAKPAEGTVTIYGGDEPAAPGAKSWVPLARDIPFNSINDKKLAKPFTRLSKYVLIETNIAEPGPIYSVNLYGERPAVSYQIVKRDQPIDVKAIYGPYVNEPTALSRASLSAGARVTFATGGGNYTSWQKAIDGNPESFTSLAGTTDKPTAIVGLAGTENMTRATVQADPVKGRLDMFAVAAAPAQPPVTAGDVATPPPVVSSAPATEIPSLEGLTPVATFVFDGTNNRVSQDFPSVAASSIYLRWTPDNGTDTLALREFNAFSGFSLADAGLQLTPEAIAELAVSDGKSFDGKDGKGLEPVKELLPVGEGFNRKPPYLPPSLGFPPPLPPIPRVPPLLPPELSE